VSRRRNGSSLSVAASPVAASSGGSGALRPSATADDVRDSPAVRDGASDSSAISRGAGNSSTVGDSASGISWAQRLVDWHAKHGRHDLPWQGTRDAYRIWLSEIMLQQTQVATVIPYYERFVARFPDVATLAAAPVDRVLEQWSGLGYYRRAHHLHAAAQAVVREHRGLFPVDSVTLETLPGIGRSTAAAIAAFAAGEYVAILDGNVKRVLARHAGIEGFPGDPRVAARLWDVAVKRLPSRDIAAARAPTPDVAVERGMSRSVARAPLRDANAEHMPSREIERYTQAMMDLGAMVCTRSRPRCIECPVAADCVALAEDRVAQLPTPRPRKPLPQRATVVLLLERAGALLFERRPSTGIWGGLWSFPEIDVDADVIQALHARFGVDASVTGEMQPVLHTFTHFALTIHPRRVAIDQWPARAESPGYLWLTPADARGAALPAPIRKILASL
jgi:A/G-specific adenine glycosylase